MDFSYIDGIEQGRAIYYYAAGDREEFSYKDGIKEGDAIFYSEDGIRLEFTYVEGERQGNATIYSPDGKKYYAYYEDGKLKERMVNKIFKKFTKDNIFNTIQQFNDYMQDFNNKRK